MTIVIVPPYPQRNDPNFANIADSWNSQLPTWTDQVNATAVDVTNKQLLAAQSVVDCQSQVTLATNQAVLAQGYKNDTLILSEATASTANVTKWISGTTYAEGVNVWSPTDYHTYRRKTAGAGTTDPLIDTTNWEPVYIPAAMILLSTATANNTAAIDFSGLDNSAYYRYIFLFENIKPVFPLSGAVTFRGILKINGTWITADVSYTGYASNTDNNPNINSAFYSTAYTDGYIFGKLELTNPSNSYGYKGITTKNWCRTWRSAESEEAFLYREKWYTTKTSNLPITDFRFMFSSGNISSGTIKLYGVKA